MPEFSTDQRKKLAQKQQAMPDGGYPIRNVSDLKNAIQAYGRATNKPAVKAWIKKRAKALGREDLLPDNWRTTSVSHGFKEVNMWNYNYSYPPYLCHHGIKGQKWGIRRFQNEDGSLTSRGKARQRNGSNSSTRSKSASKKSKTSSKKERGKQTKFKSTVEKGSRTAGRILKEYGPVAAKSAAILALSAVGIPYGALLVTGVASIITGEDISLPGVTSRTTHEMRVEMDPIKKVKQPLPY